MAIQSLSDNNNGVNLKEKPYEAFKHGVNLIKHQIAPEKIPGTKSFRESETNPDKFPWQEGNEICLMVTAKDGVIQRTPENMCNKIIKPLADELTDLIKSIPNEGQRL